MNNRTYNKLYLSKNREQGNEKMLLGYQSDVTEILLKKDYETYFHVPSYSSPLMLSASSLIDDGAIGGLFPAASDRITQSRKNYGTITNNGNMLSSVANGMWFCSWLRKNSDGTQQWMDRYYDPGSLYSSNAGTGTTGVSALLYTIHDPAIEDVPSELTLDPGVLYKYYHVGEQTAIDLVKTLDGTDGQLYSVFDLEEWGISAVDTSQNAMQIVVNSQAPNSELYPDIEDPQRVDQKLISFDHNYDAECYLSWNENLSLSDEFTLSFWVRSDQWENCANTQLAGNFSSKGGVGVFVDSLSSFPLFVIPETNYGHVLIVNEDGIGITDKLTKLGAFDQASPKFVCIDTNNNIIICHNDGSGTVYKINHLGTVLQSTKDNEYSGFSGFSGTELPVGLFCGSNNDIWTVTTENIYVFDTNLTLKQTIPNTATATTVFAFSSDSLTDEFGLVSDENSIDIKFAEKTKWSISNTDFNLYRNDELFHEFVTPASNFQIDPQGRVWVLHGNNDVSVLDPGFTDEEQKVLLSLDIGTNTTHAAKTISFIQTYDRETQTFEWVALIHYADETSLYMVDMDGLLFKTININNLYRNQLLKELDQDPAYFEYYGKGDFTGYEHRRVFKALSPFENKRQLILKASLRDFARTANNYSIFTCQCSIDGWDNKSWQHVAVTYQNKEFKIFVNGTEKTSLQHGGRYGLSYEQQPTWFFGTPVGYKNGFNKEIGHPSMIFNGYIQSVKLYSRCLTESELLLLLRSNIVADDIYWTLPTPVMQYVEKIERVFKHKLPGSKSPLYKIKLANFPVDDPIIRSMIEEEIRKIVTEINPGYVDFVEVEWL